MEIRQITILTSRLNEVRTFYSSLLGFTVIDDSASSVTFEAGTSTFTFLADHTHAYYHFAFGIPFNRFQEAFRWLEDRTEILSIEDGGKIADFKNWNAQSFYFHDPAGNIVEFIARYHWNAAADGVFSVAEIYSINEIGLVSADIRSVAHEFEEMGLAHYFRGPKLNDFMPMGDDNGLLLLCATGKNWMPTGRPAEQFPIKISVFENNREYNLAIEEK
ncbi:MAG TPA: VOC family protein [Sphingobacteriaceae bacterium]